MDLKAFLDWVAFVVGMGGGLAPIVSALVAVIKTAGGEHLPSRYYPSIALAVGVAVAEFVAWVLATDPRLALLIGVVAGLTASELFRAGKATEGG